MTLTYPWHQAAWQQIQNYQNEKRFPHALLISGVPGLAKKTFVERLARILLCEKQNENCTDCFSCRLADLRGHPDYSEMVPADDSKAIKIEQIRDIIDFISQTTNRSGNRVILIAPAEMMNIAAANALLKTLEEPPSGSHFLLISHSPAQLPATVRSRCQSIKIYPSFDEATVSWVAQQIQQDRVIAAALLERADGSPQQAVELAQQNINQIQQQLLDELAGLLIEPFQLLSIAVRWQKQGLLSVLDNLIRLLNNIVKQRVTLTGEQCLLASISLEKLIQYTQYVFEVRKELILNPNLNPQLLSETLLYRWLSCVVLPNVLPIASN
ncbi:MAG: DNA polymerase III subunit delta' [Legionellales bacterium]|nr:DNA polymerase III subunit delta' [Legionellales bacterium]